jgi:hypothetical protein
VTSWGIVATVKAPLGKIWAFAAWHLHLGAARIFLCFDDPDDPAFAHLSHPRLSMIRCDAAHWRALGGRPDRHQNRQSKNAAHVYRRAGVAWLAHADVDEFLLPDRPMAGILGDLPPDQILCRAEPFEAMHDPTLPDDIYTATQFRGALKPRHAALRAPVLGRFADVLPEAMLSHANGKALFRTGIAGLSPRLHGAFRDGQRLDGPPFQPGLRLLHFHAQDRAAWLAALPYRLTRGAYQYHPALQDFLARAPATEIGAFYDETQVLTPAKAELLRSEGRLVETRLALREKVTEWF